jgi:hypothetical protein
MSQEGKNKKLCAAFDIASLHEQYPSTTSKKQAVVSCFL